jgi:hypothetical protein
MKRSPSLRCLFLTSAALVMLIVTGAAGAAPPEFRTYHQQPPIMPHPSGTTRLPAEPKDEGAVEQVLQVAEAGGPIYNAGESMSKNMVARLNRLSITQRTNALRSLGINRPAAHSAAVNMGKNIKKFGERLDFLDKTATAGEWPAPWPAAMPWVPDRRW